MDWRSVLEGRGIERTRTAGVSAFGERILEFLASDQAALDGDAIAVAVIAHSLRVENYKVSSYMRTLERRQLVSKDRKGFWRLKFSAAEPPPADDPTQEEIVVYFGMRKPEVPDYHTLRLSKEQLKRLRSEIDFVLGELD